mgnify:CR=1 FL=1
MSYGQIAAAAEGEIEVPRVKASALKDPANFRLIGHEIEGRIDSRPRGPGAPEPVAAAPTAAASPEQRGGLDLFLLRLANLLDGSQKIVLIVVVIVLGRLNSATSA